MLINFIERSATRSTYRHVKNYTIVQGMFSELCRKAPRSCDLMLLFVLSIELKAQLVNMYDTDIKRI